MSGQRVRVALMAWALLCVSDAETFAQTDRTNPPPGCRGAKAPIPEPWRAWTQTPAAVSAATSPAIEATITAGKKVAVTLAPAAAVRMAVTVPDGNRRPNPHSGMLSFQVPRDGTYWVSVSTDLWVDVVQGNAILMEMDERHGPPCSGIVKSLQYKLNAGEARIQLSDSPGARVDIIVVRQP